ncbi:MAG TPA: PLP-dependent aminotransferase family protein [Solirubrobacteraceae bacterium]|jgi:DNA-binding transcriptional MocR family regulator|nr:PLP-dependent aminotransferase family protein [Solirubrobacteraceae bacterium]
MDQQVARALGELERKLEELERTLHAIGAGETGTEEEPASHGAGRIVDETVERTPPAGRPPGPPPGAPASPPPPSEAPASPPPPQPRPAIVASPSLRAAPPRAPQTPRQAPAASPAELLRFRDRIERAARELTHDYDELLGRLSYAAVPTTTGPTISFARGAPSLDIVDVDGLREAAVRAFESDPAGTTAYGTAIGYPRLRSWIADRHGVEPERVLITNGSMQADAFLFEQLVRAGDEVIVERPTYDRTLLSLRQRGARVHAVALETDGIDTDALARLLAGAQPTLAHIIPNFQNPAGYTLSYEKRRRLLELAAEHGFMVFEDDPYVELRFTGETLPTMLSMDPERVVYASSFSKTVCPGIRVGYLVGPTELIASIAQLATNTYISPNMVAQSIVYEFCASGAIDRSIETVKTALAERVQTLADSLRSELPEAEFVAPQGGYFMWVTLPDGTDVGALFQAAAERGVAFVKGTDFLLEGGENTLRLAYSGVTPEQIRTGVARLAEAYRSIS